MGQSFIPRTEGARDLWLKNFANKLPQYAARYNITPAEVADVQQGALNITFWLLYKRKVHAYDKMMTQYKKDMQGSRALSTVSAMPVFPAAGTLPPVVSPGIMLRVNSIALRIKKHIDFTEADGKDLGIASVRKTTPDLSAIKPRLSVKLMNGGAPEINWIKQGMEGIEIEVDRGDGKFQLLTIDMYPNHVDEYKLPKGETALWKYKGIYRWKDKRVGQWSDETRITVEGM